MLRVGIVGLPNVGKSTLFNALTRQRVPAENYPFTTVDPNVGVVAIPDERLSKIARVVGSKKATPATIEFVDVAGLVKGAHTGAGLGNEFLSHLRAVDALVHVVRAFDDENVARAGSTTPEEDIATIQAELRAKDEEIARRRERRAEDGERRNDDARLSEKPVLTVFNAGEDAIACPPASLAALARTFTPSVILSAKIEWELAELPAAERPPFLSAYGLDRLRATDIIRETGTLLRLVTFYTANENEARAWVVPDGTTVVDAAANVHTDFAERFLRAEATAADDLIAAGSPAAARERGRTRDAGREDTVRHGDVLLFKVRG